ncbi:hypothetical protein [Thaumasiovibrio subtropicus]|uniref:hypothetical protein n=1 Tax=Thaumasiovibrio subtropicus TaxID=1891207 RepID=UPI000B35CD89|nr:hypothetical protein [Thaumasiovibrio subtropicus]
MKNSIDLSSIKAVAEKHCIEREEFAALDCDTDSLLQVQREELAELVEVLPQGDQVEFVEYYQKFTCDLCADDGMSDVSGFRSYFYLFGLLVIAFFAYLASL